MPFDIHEQNGLVFLTSPLLSGVRHAFSTRRGGVSVPPWDSLNLGPSQGDDPAAFADSVIMYEILSELKEIAARTDGITCSCGSKSYGMEIHSTYVDLVCKSCGAKLRIPAATDEDLDRLCCRMKLQIKSE